MVRALECRGNGRGGKATKHGLHLTLFGLCLTAAVRFGFDSGTLDENRLQKHLHYEPRSLVIRPGQLVPALTRSQAAARLVD